VKQEKFGGGCREEQVGGSDRTIKIGGRKYPNEGNQKRTPRAVRRGISWATKKTATLAREEVCPV